MSYLVCGKMRAVSVTAYMLPCLRQVSCKSRRMQMLGPGSGLILCLFRRALTATGFKEQVHLRRVFVSVAGGISPYETRVSSLLIFTGPDP